MEQPVINLRPAARPVCFDREGFLERLLGFFSDGTPLSEIAQETRCARSVADQVQRILAASHEFPPAGAGHRIVAAARENLEAALCRHEPRLERCRVASCDAGRAGLRILASLRSGERLTLAAERRADGQILVKIAE